MLGLTVHSQGSCSAFSHLTLHLTNIVGGLAVGRLWKGDSSPFSLGGKNVLQLLLEGLAWSSSFQALLSFPTLGPQFPDAPIPLALPSVGTCARSMRMV